MADDFNPAALGATPVAATLPAPPVADGGFNPADKGATLVSAPNAAPTYLARQPEENAHWNDLYSGLDSLDARTKESSESTPFYILDRVTDNPKEARARVINQAFLSEKTGIGGQYLDRNWEASKVAYAKDQLGLDVPEMSDEILYDHIAGRIGAKGIGEQGDATAEIKPWTWKDSLRSDYITAQKNVDTFMDSISHASIPDLMKALPEKNLPDNPWLGAYNPAVMHGTFMDLTRALYQKERPVVGAIYEGGTQPAADAFLSPVGAAGLGVFSEVSASAEAGSAMAKKAMVGMEGGFSAWMARGVADQAPEWWRMMRDPNTPLNDKIRSSTAIATNAAFASMGALGVAFDSMPKDQAKALSGSLEGKKPSDAAEELRKAAVTAPPEAANNLNRAAAEMDELAQHEAGVANWATDGGGGAIGGQERIVSAAIKTADGNITQGPSHDAIKEELGAEETEPPAAAPEKTPLAQKVSAAVAKNEDGAETSFTDLVDEIEAIASDRETPGHGELQEAVDAFRQEQEDDREMAGRNDMDQAEAAFRGTIDRIASETQAPTPPIKAVDGSQEGFVTSTGRFVPRDEATPIAQAAGQLAPEAAANPPDELHSHQVDMGPARRPTQTSLKNAYDELERVAYGFDEAPPTEQRAMAERWERSAEVLKKDPNAGARLAAELAKNPNLGLTDDQSALLLRHKVDLENRVNDAASRAFDENLSEESRKAAAAELEPVAKDLNNLLDAIRERGSEWGREGRWRQAIARMDYSFAAQERLLTEAKGGQALSEVEKATLQSRIDQLEELNRKLSEAKLTKQLTRRSPPPTRGRARIALSQAADAAKERLRAKLARLNDATQLLADAPETMKDLSVIGADYLVKFGENAAEWGSRLAADFGDWIKPHLQQLYAASKYELSHRGFNPQEFLAKSIGDAGENLRRRLSMREGTGVASNRATRFHDDQGRPIFIGAEEGSTGKSMAAWKEETERWLSKDEIGKFRKWYSELKSYFVDYFGEKEAPRMMMAWLAGQQNASPAAAMGYMFKVMDRLYGIPQLKASGEFVRGGLGDAKIEAILTGKPPEKGFGPKLTDFSDAGMGRTSLRTYMGQNPEGGAPFVGDVWTGRDSGHIDHQTVSRLIRMSDEGNLFVDGKKVEVTASKYKIETEVDENGRKKTKRVPVEAIVRVEGEKGYKIKIDMRGSPGGTQYEGISTWGNKLAKDLGNWEGGNWEPAEVQAVGWMRTLRQYGEKESTVESTVESTMTENTHRIYAEVNYSSGSFLKNNFPAMGDLPVHIQAKITSQVMNAVVPKLGDIIKGSFRLIAMGQGDGLFGSEPSPSMAFELLSTEHTADITRIALGYVTEQRMTMGVRMGLGGDNNRVITFRKSDGSPLTVAERQAMISRAKVGGVSYHELPNGFEGLIADAGAEETGFKPKAISKARAEEIVAAMDAWAKENGISLEAETSIAKVSGDGHDWSKDPTGGMYLASLDARGVPAEVREQIVRLRRGYPAIVAEAFRDHAPDAVPSEPGSEAGWVQRIIDKSGPELGQRPEVPKDTVNWLSDTGRQALERMKGRVAHLNDISSVLDPEGLRDIAIVGADLLYHTGINSAKWAAEMIDQLGEKIRPHLDQLFKDSVNTYRSQMVDALLPHDGDDVGNMDRVATQLARTFIEQGMKDRDQIVDSVHQALLEKDPTLQRREVMDAISGYGKYRPLTHDEITDRLRDVKGQLQQVAKLQDMAAGKAPKKTGMERRVPGDEERRLQQEVEEAKKKGGYAVTDPEKQLRTSLQAQQRSLENRIKDLANELETGERRPKGTPAPTSPEIEALKALRDRIAQTLDEVAGQKMVAPEERIRKALESTTKATEKLESDLQAGKVFPDTTGKSEPWSPELAKKKQYLAELKAFRKEIQDVVEPPMTPEERALAGVKSGMAREMKKLEKEIATRQRIVKEKTGVTYDDEAEEMKSRLEALRKEHEQVFGPKNLSDEQRLNIWKANANRRLANLQQRLRDKNFEPKPKAIPPPKDDEANKIEQAIARTQQDFDIARERAKEAALPTSTKVAKGAAKVSRFLALTGYHTLEKLFTFSVARYAERMATTAMDPLLRILPGFRDIAAKANLEMSSFKGADGKVHGSMYDSLAAFYTEAAMHGTEEFWQTITKGKSNLEAQLGEHKFNTQPLDWTDAPGLVHKAEKSILKRSAYAQNLQNDMAWAIANGIWDGKDDMVAGALKHEAFKEANRTILQEDNMYAKMLSGAQRIMEGWASDRPMVQRELIALRYIFDATITRGIVKTPFNMILQSLERSPVGALRAAIYTTKVRISGVSGMTNAEANMVTRLWKVGAIGSAMFVWGAIDATKDPKDRMFGGFYQPGDKRGDDDVQWGRVRIGNRQIPPYLTEALAISAQMGNTFTRVAFSRISKKDSRSKGIIAGTMATVLSLASQAPVVNPMTQTASKLERGRADQILYDEIASYVPQFSANLAQDMDGKSRIADSLFEHIELNVPKARENVPETKAQKKRDIRQSLMPK